MGNWAWSLPIPFNMLSRQRCGPWKLASTAVHFLKTKQVLLNNSMEVVFGSVGRSRSRQLHGSCRVSHHLCGPEAGLTCRGGREGSARWLPSWDHGSHPPPNWYQHEWTEPTKPPPSFPMYPSKQPCHSSFVPLGTPCPELLDSGLFLVTLGAPAPGLELPSPPLYAARRHAMWKDVCSIKIQQ